MIPFRDVISGLFLIAVCVGIANADHQQRPNVVVILADDQGWGDLSVHGNANLTTPHIDSLARDGALFERFFACPVCSPTRAEFLTGRYHPRGGVYSTSQGGERLDLDEKTIGDAFRAAGYATAAFGKWHNGTQYPYHPNARGFEEFYGFCSGHWGNYFSPQLEHNGQLVRGNGFIIDDLTDHALQFIEQNQQRPFFCYLPLNTPHSPMQVPGRFFDRFEHKSLSMLHKSAHKEERNNSRRNTIREDIRMTRAALAMCENIDWNVGRILTRLEELELTKNTIVVYFSDNGPNSWRWNDRMKGRKGSTDEGGVRVPCLVRWPNHIEPGMRIPEIAGAIDLLPTLAELASIPTVNPQPLDGVSLKPLLLKTTTQWPDRLIFSHWRGRVSVRSQKYRLDHQGHLFDMQDDPEQSHDVTQDQPEITRRLKQLVENWKKELLPELAADNRPLPVGYTQFPTTLLPARDGKGSGNIKRSNKFPNCSYFTNWTTTSERMTWDIEVNTTGRYEAVIYYTCAAEDLGATIELKFNGSRIRGTISRENNPPLRGQEHDRYPRSESEVKDFRPLVLGEIPLRAGRGPLTLQATEIPGGQVMDVRYVVLTMK